YVLRRHPAAKARARYLREVDLEVGRGHLDPGRVAMGFLLKPLSLTLSPRGRGNRCFFRGGRGLPLRRPRRPLPTSGEELLVALPVPTPLPVPDPAHGPL